MTIVNNNKWNQLPKESSEGYIEVETRERPFRGRMRYTLNAIYVWR